MISFTDQLERTVYLPSYPKRIISVVPSQTELLFDLGLREEVVGITKFCVHPHQWFRNKTRVGGTKTLDFKIIDYLQPDLIIANKEENTKEQIEELAVRYPVWISDVNNLKAAMQMVVSIGEITNTQKKANEIKSEIETRFNEISGKIINTAHRPKTAYLIWKNPYITIGTDTFINAMLSMCGLTNAFEHLTRYPEISITDLQNTKCELLLLSSEPYPFTQKHIEELQHHLPKPKIMLADGEMFSWYGSRLLKSANYFENFLKELRT